MTEPRRVAFRAEIKKVETRKLGSEDKGGRIVLEFNIYKDDNLIGQLDALFEPQKEVFVVIAEKEK